MNVLTLFNFYIKFNLNHKLKLSLKLKFGELFDVITRTHILLVISYYNGIWMIFFQGLKHNELVSCKR
jgi:hypothetical protein